MMNDNLIWFFVAWGLISIPFGIVIGKFIKAGRKSRNNGKARRLSDKD